MSKAGLGSPGNKSGTAKDRAEDRGLQTAQLGRGLGSGPELTRSSQAVDLRVGAPRKAAPGG